MSTLQHSTIDVVAHDPKNDRVVLAMTEPRSWNAGSKELLADIREKLNTYVGYVAQGQLARDYPQLSEKKVEFRLICPDRPDDEAIAVMLTWKEVALTPRDIIWSVTILPAEMG